MQDDVREQNILENVAPKFTSENDTEKFACGSKFWGGHSVRKRFGKDVWQKQRSPELFEARTN